jgi:serine/threonine-protein kinase
VSDPVVTRLNTALEDRYRIERELGAGGMATVYLAEDLKHHRKVAVKVLKPELASALGAERFLREIEIAANLTHPHILPVHDSGEADGLLYFVMPYVEGESLRQRLDRERQLPIDDALQIAREVAGALDLAHRRGVIHRDIKPANVLFEEGQAVVADFGIAKAVAATGQERLTQTGLSVGTPQYMSPEQATGEPTDARSDIYSLGAVLYEMLTGEPPYTGPTTHAIVAKLITERPIRPRVLRETVPERVDQAVMKTLARSPADRFATAGELADVLAGAAVAGPAARLPRLPVQWAIAAGLTLAVVGIGWWVSARGRAEPMATDPIAAPRTTPFLATVAIEKQPAWNPAGNLIAYVSDESGNDDVWISDLSGANRLNLTETHTGADAHPTWSPDGQHLAFYSIRDGAGVYTMTSLGGAVRKVTAVTAGVLYTFSLQWAPDGKLVYTDFDEAGTKQVYSISALGSGKECLTCGLPNLDGQSGQLSPNGELLAFKDSDTGPSRLYVTHLASGRVVTIGSLGDRPP